MAEIEMVEVVRVESVIGQGIADDPVRRIVEWFLKDGSLLVRQDLWADEVKRRLAESVEVVVDDDAPPVSQKYVTLNCG